MTTLSAPAGSARLPALEEPGRSWSRRRPGRSLPSWLAAVASSAVVAGLYTLLYARNERYFYIDDAITGEMPNRLSIGRLLRAGEWPWLSTDFVNGAAHGIEYSHGIWNPFNLAISYLLAGSQDMGLAGFLLITFHAVVLTLAASWLAHVVGLNAGWSIAFAVSLGFQPFTVVWNAAAWYEGLFSLAWLVLAMAAAFAFHLQPRRRYGWVVLLSTYLLCTSGWPLGVPVLGLIVFVLLVMRLVSRCDLRQTIWLAVWFASGLAASLIALFPLLTSGSFASRNSSINNEGNFNVAPLEGLLQFANPGYYGFFNNFGGFELQELPHFYVAWFVLPVLVFLKAWPRDRGALVLLRSSVVLTALFALAALGPARLEMFRFPTRFVQYFAFFLLLSAALLVAHGRFEFSRRRLLVALGLAGLLTVNALQADPLGTDRILQYGLAVALLCAAVWATVPAVAGRRATTSHGSSVASQAVVALGTVGILLSLALDLEQGRGVDWGFPHDLTQSQTLSLDDYTLNYGRAVPVDGFDEFRWSMIGVTVGDRQVNGYTSLGNRQFRKHFPMDDSGDFAPGQAEAFLKRDPGTSLTWLELLRVDQIIATKGEMDDDLVGTLGPEWDRSDGGEYTVRYRHAPYELPGLVSYASPGLELGPVPVDCPRQASRECVRITRAEDDDNRLVFARLWFPGYRATLDGDPLEVERYDDVLVSVVVPEGRTGDMVLSYRAPGALELGALTVLGLPVLALLAWQLGGVSPRRMPFARRRIEEPDYADAAGPRP